jgi:hypothetical protein
MFAITCCGASMSPDQSLIAVGDFSGFVRIFDVASKKMAGEYFVGSATRYLQFDKLVKRLLIAGYDGNLQALMLDSNELKQVY